MPTCKDCLHYGICVFHLKGDENQKCIHFKNNAGYCKQEWISVDDGLPDREGKYLTYTAKGTVEISNFYTCWLGTKSQFDYWITHWMPLPKPPTEKEN